MAPLYERNEQLMGGFGSAVRRNEGRAWVMPKRGGVMLWRRMLGIGSIVRRNLSRRWVMMGANWEMR